MTTNTSETPTLQEQIDFLQAELKALGDQKAMMFLAGDEHTIAYLDLRDTIRGRMELFHHLIEQKDLLERMAAAGK